MFLFGVFLALVTSTSSFNLNMFTVLGILVTIMGLIVSILGARMNSANSSIQSDEQR